MPSYISPSCSRRDLADILSLLNQLTDIREFTADDVHRVLRSPNTHVCVARYSDEQRIRIVGMATVTINYARMFTRDFVTAFIGDVVVDRNHLRRGLGEQLMRKVIEKARQEGAAHVSLTSNSHNPRREPAIKLYEKLGFQKIGELHGSNYYRLNLKGS